MKLKRKGVKYTPADVDVCPCCKSEVLTTYDSRNAGYGRRRCVKCNECGYRFQTIEIFLEEYEDYMALRHGIEGVKDVVESLSHREIFGIDVSEG